MGTADGAGMMVGEDVSGFGGATGGSPVTRTMNHLRQKAGGQNWAETDLIKAVMRHLDGREDSALIVAAAVLRLFVERSQIEDIWITDAAGSTQTWGLIARTIDREAWFSAAGDGTRNLYDAEMAKIQEHHERTGDRPTMTDVLDAILTLPKAVVVAGIIDFTLGFLDNETTAPAVNRFVRIVFDTALLQPTGARG